MNKYYSASLNTRKLQKCYEIAPARVQQYLAAEIEFVLQEAAPTDTVLDLGCGYGRVAVELAKKVTHVVGIDLSKENIEWAQKRIRNKKCTFHTMNAIDLKFPGHRFDLVICIQNGISAFNVNPVRVLKEAIRVTKKGGSVLFSTYSKKFWKDRLEWFQRQSEQNLIGEIDYELTRNGVIICKDGFKAVTYSEAELKALAANFQVQTTLHEVDNSSLFCKLLVE